MWRAGTTATELADILTRCGKHYSESLLATVFVPAQLDYVRKVRPEL